MSRIILCGAGTIVTALAPYLSKLKYDITIVTRSPERVRKQVAERYDVISWEALRSQPEKYLVDCDAVVNCARPNVGSLAKSTMGMQPSAVEGIKEAFKSGGVKSTQIIAKLCAQHADPKRTVYVNASAYNHFNFQDPKNHHSPYSDLAMSIAESPRSFFTEVSQAWEAAAKPAVDANIRVIHLGLGMIIDKNSTGFQGMLSLFEKGLGGRIGSGEQQIPMITMHDVLAAIVHCIKTPALRDYVNVAGFNVKQGVLAKALAKKISELPTSEQGWVYSIFKTLCCRFCNNIPKSDAFIKTGLGIFGELLLQGLAIESEKLKTSGFNFRHRTLTDALDHVFAPLPIEHTQSQEENSLETPINLKWHPSPLTHRLSKTNTEDKVMSLGIS